MKVSDLRLIGFTFGLYDDLTSGLDDDITSGLYDDVTSCLHDDREFTSGLFELPKFLLRSFNVALSF